MVFATQNKLRSIPACAGEASRLSAWRLADSVYPCVCGGSGLIIVSLHHRPGLSPRVRGKRHAVFVHLDALRSIPACAGEARWPRRW